MSKSRQAPIILGFALSGGILIYLLSQLQWSAFVTELGKINFLVLVPLFIIFVVSNWIRALRWQYLLPSGLGIQTTKLFSAISLGTLATCVIPLRAGEFVRPWVLSRGKQVSFPLAFSSVVIERVFDVLAMLCLFAYALSGIDEPPLWASVCAKGLGTLAGIILVGMVVAYFQSALVKRLITLVLNKLFSERFPAATEKLLAFAFELIEGLKTISSVKELFWTVFWSMTLWLAMSLYYYLGLVCFGLYPEFNVGNVVNVFVALAVAIPSAPGFVGTFQFGCDAALNGLYSYTKEFSIAYSVILHSVQLLSTIVLGFFMLRYEGLSFKALKMSVEKER